MKFIVEDGTGIPLANSFVDVDFIDTYAQEMGKDDKWGVAFDSEGLPLTFDAIQKRNSRLQYKDLGGYPLRIRGEVSN